MSKSASSGLYAILLVVYACRQCMGVPVPQMNSDTRILHKHSLVLKELA